MFTRLNHISATDFGFGFVRKNSNTKDFTTRLYPESAGKDSSDPGFWQVDKKMDFFLQRNSLKFKHDSAEKYITNWSWHFTGQR